MASESILTEPLNIPAINLMIIKKMFENIESLAVFTFLFNRNKIIWTKIDEFINIDKGLNNIIYKFAPAIEFLIADFRFDYCVNYNKNLKSKTNKDP